ncbi:DUF1796 family putative cysteine peptidase [Synechococcus sp. AH-736-M20]|nr:DUF1796 family putative cysteine peptidase [Synechococcus sp. AH-736-M20]
MAPITNLSEETTWLACGENCMPIDVLRRHGKNAPSTPYSTGRSDAEHLEYFETSTYQNFLEESYLIKSNAFTNECYINVSKRSSGKLKPGRHQYLEFTHHNPLEPKDNKILRRRIERMIEIRSKDTPHCFFYHHRSQRGFETTRELIKEKMMSVINNYKQATTALCYSQKIVANKSQRGVEVIQCADGRILFFTLKTLLPWAGNNLDIFFGKTDDDLFKRVFQIQEKLFKNALGY